MFTSTDGGKNWTHAISVQQVTDPCFFIDPVIGRCVMDGIAGARNDLAAAPSVDIANGAPTGAGATNLIVDAWADGRDGLNNEGVLFSYSRDGGQNWSSPTRICSLPGNGRLALLAPGGPRSSEAGAATGMPIDVRQFRYLWRFVGRSKPVSQPE